MFGRCRQTARLGTRTVRSAGRVMGQAFRRVGRGLSKGFTKAAKQAATGAVGYRLYKSGRKVARVIAGNPYAGGNDWTVSKRTVGRKKKLSLPTVNKMMRVGLNNMVFRYQNISNFDTNVGALTISNWQQTGGQVIMPVHIYDITSFPNVGNYVPGKYYYWSDLTSNANCVRGDQPGQSPTGVPDGGAWNIEHKGGVNPTTTYPNASRMVHNWTDVRLNLYGARKRTTKFEVIFFRCVDEFANPHHAATSNVDYRELMAYLERPCIYSNLQTYNGGRVDKKIKIIKKFTYFVSASQSTDVDTSVGKIKEARIFLRHNRVYNLDYKHRQQDAHVFPHEQADGIDYEQDVTHHDSPWYGSQVYMCIRAFAPERTLDKTWGTAADANKDPTYDIVIRNSVSVPA